MTCAQPHHQGVPCWTWTCGDGAGCGHGHTATAKEREAAAHAHQARHAHHNGHPTPPPGPAWQEIVDAGHAPVLRMEHHDPRACPHCQALAKRPGPDFY